MAAIFAQMRGNAVGAGLRCKKGGSHRIWMRYAARITDRRHVIDIDP